MCGQKLFYLTRSMSISQLYAVFQKILARKMSITRLESGAVSDNFLQRTDYFRWYNIAPTHSLHVLAFI